MLDEKILKIFKSKTAQYVSGADISKALSVSRTAVWKHIELLRQQGYEIEACPHLGYRLLNIPDKLLAQEIEYNLGNKILGSAIHSYAEVDSTNDIAHKLGRSGIKEGLVILSEAQHKGRGRLSRKWVSPSGYGIYLSIILRPNIPPNDAPKITLLAAVSVAEAIRKVTGLSAVIKWPNDILINNKKVAGILTEMDAEVDMIRFIVLGIGINVNTPLRLLPAGAGSLKEELDKKVSRIELAKEILRKAEANYFLLKNGRFDSILSKYKSFSETLSKHVKITSHNKIIEGQAIDIDPSGALVLRFDNGFTQNITTGDTVNLR